MQTREKEPPQQWIARLDVIGARLDSALAGLDNRSGGSTVSLPGIVAGEVVAGMGDVVCFIAIRKNPRAWQTTVVARDQPLVGAGLDALRPRHPGVLLRHGSHPFAPGSY